MATLLELDDEDKRELRRNQPFINDVADLVSAMPIVAVFAGIARSGMTGEDVDALMDLLNMISHSYWVGAKDDGEGIAAVMRELGEASK
jgi:hypothetical protein